jgi:TRAP-type C4-dicarboxylate transport system substrate-binding protein
VVRLVELVQRQPVVIEGFRTFGSATREMNDRMMKIPLSLAAASIIALSVAGCGGADDGSSFQLTFGSSVPSASYVATQSMSKTLLPGIAARVAAETPYTLTFDEQFGTLVRAGEELTGIESGLVDIGTTIFPYEPAALAGYNYPYYVPFSSPDAEVAISAFRAVYESHQAQRAVLLERNQQPLAFFALGDYGLITTDGWTDASDLRGRPIAGSGINLYWLKGLGVSPVSLPGGEWYTAFQTGVVQGAITSPDGVRAMSFDEVVDHFTNLHFGSLPMGSVNINTRTWDRLPAEVQDIVREGFAEWEMETAALVNDAWQESLTDIEANGMRITEPAPALRQEWAEQLKDLPAEGAQRLDHRGLPGASMIEDYIDTQVGLGYQFPVRYAVGE